MDWDTINNSTPIKYKLSTTFEEAFVAETVKDLEVLDDSNSNKSWSGKDTFILCQFINKTDKACCWIE